LKRVLNLLAKLKLTYLLEVGNLRLSKNSGVSVSLLNTNSHPTIAIFVRN
jgi:hypothetical protein